jgi:NitT/TauT family transport system substrate-binding protein
VEQNESGRRLLDFARTRSDDCPPRKHPDRRAASSGHEDIGEEGMQGRSVAAAIIGILFACVAAAAGAAEPVKIRAAWVAPVANWATILLEKKDLMPQLGKSYSLEPVRYQSTSAMITAMATGELEIGNLAYSSFAIAIENAGLSDLRIIADEFQDGVEGYYSNEFIVLKESPIRKIEDVKGRIIATNAAGSGVDIALRALLRRHGLEDKRDFTMVETGLANMKAMLIDKKIDLGTTTMPFAEDPELRKAMRTIATQKEAIGPSQFVFWVMRAGFIQKNRAAVADFMTDTLRVVRFYLDPNNHKAAVDIAARVTKLPPERFDSWLFTKKDFYRDPDMVPNVAALQANLDMQKDMGFLKAKIDVTKYVDLSLIQEAAKRLQ